MVYNFNIEIEGVWVVNGVTLKLRNVGFDDAKLFSREGRTFLEFDREAHDFEAAVKSAIESIGKIPYLGIVSVEGVQASVEEVTREIMLRCIADRLKEVS